MLNFQVLFKFSDKNTQWWITGDTGYTYRYVIITVVIIMFSVFRILALFFVPLFVIPQSVKLIADVGYIIIML